ncbi:MAG: major capsid protein [Dehalococcoidia bacterium]
MALTLTEAAKLSNDVVLQGVIETIVKDSPILQLLPFIDLVGNALTYNRENTAAGANWFAVGDTWTEGTPTFTQVTATLKILGGDADVDQYLATTRSNVQDLEAAVVELKAKAVRQEFEDVFLNGDGTSNKFTGLKNGIAGGQTVSMGTNGAALTLTRLDELIDLVKPGRPDLLLMSKRSRRGLSQIVRTSGAFMETRQTEFGTFQEFYAGIPVGVSDYVSDADTQGSATNASRVYAIQFGEGAVSGLQGPSGLQVERVGSLETKDAVRWRIKWYVGLAIFNDLSVGQLTGVLPV